jgi:adenylate kinase family enzyme
MPNPYLLVVTGRPGSGKTTFAKALSDEIYMPVISRDQIKEGYVQTSGKKHNDLPQETNRIATDIFFDIIKMLLDNNVSLIAEAAFQHNMWASRLECFKEMARVYIFICKVEDKIALDRFIKRGINNTYREYFHGDKGVEMVRKGMKSKTSIYEEPRLDVSTYHIDTLDVYNPSIQELVKMILSERSVIKNKLIEPV